MTLAAIIPIGYLDRHGYQHTYRQCIGAACAGADVVIVLPSIRDTAGLAALAGEHDNLLIVEGYETWFSRKPSGEHWFDAYRVMESVNVGLREAHWRRYDQAVCVMCNWFLPPAAWEALREPVNGWGWVYKREHLAGQMFSVNKRLPFVVRCGADVRFTTDAIVADGEFIPWEDGCWPEWDGAAAVDLQYELEPDDLATKIEFIRNYRDLKPKNAGMFSLPQYVEHHRARFRERVKAWDAPPLVLGNADFVSKMILEAL